MKLPKAPVSRLGSELSDPRPRWGRPGPVRTPSPVGLGGRAIPALYPASPAQPPVPLQARRRGSATRSAVNGRPVAPPGLELTPRKAPTAM